jgi:4-amino-4-deoxy-L-arabinose transferase-like glycosyltransferase
MMPRESSASHGRDPSTTLGVKLLWAVAIAFTSLRFVALDADPAHLLLPVFFTDEGWYSLNARNHALFGHWVMDEHNVALVLCPLHTLALRASYALFGVSFWSTRIVGAVASALTVGLIGWRLRSRPSVAALACALVAAQPILFAISRVAFCESLQLLFVTATWVFASDEKRRWSSWVLAGAAASLAMFAKASAIYAPVLAVTAPFLTAPAGTARRSLREASLVVLGGVAVVLAFLPFELRFLDLLSTEFGHEGSVMSLVPRGAELLALIGLKDGAQIHPAFWLGILPWMVLVSVVGARQVLSRAEDSHCAARRLALAWIGCSLCVLCMQRWPALPERYWMNLLPPLACLAASGCWAKVESDRVGALRSWAAALLLAFGPMLLVRSLAQAVALPGNLDPARSFQVLACVSIVAAGVLTVAFHRLELPRRIARARVVPTTLAVLVLACSVLASADVLRARSYSLRDTSRALVDPGASRVLVGNVANSLSLETPYRAFVRRNQADLGLGTGWINRDWRALGATHWLTDLWIGEEPEPRPPTEGAVLVRSYPLWPDASGRSLRVLHLWSLVGAAALDPQRDPGPRPR